MSMSARELEQSAPWCGHSANAVACEATVGYWLAVIRAQLSHSVGPMASSLQREKAPAEAGA